MKWTVEQEEDYFRIFDAKKDIAGYFDPDYGIDPSGPGASEQIQEMISAHSRVSGGFVMVPLAKFGIFDTDYESDLAGLEGRLHGVLGKAAAWKGFFAGGGSPDHYVRISHTDHDMLSITFPVRFGQPVALKHGDLAAALGPMLDELGRNGLL